MNEKFRAVMIQDMCKENFEGARDDENIYCTVVVNNATNKIASVDSNDALYDKHANSRFAGKDFDEALPALKQTFTNIGNTYWTEYEVIEALIEYYGADFFKALSIWHEDDDLNFKYEAEIPEGMDMWYESFSDLAKGYLESSICEIPDNLKGAIKLDTLGRCIVDEPVEFGLNLECVVGKYCESDIYLLDAYSLHT